MGHLLLCTDPLRKINVLFLNVYPKKFSLNHLRQNQQNNYLSDKK